MAKKRRGSAKSARGARKTALFDLRENKALLMALGVGLVTFLILTALSLISQRNGGEEIVVGESTGTGRNVSALADIAVRDYGTITVALDAAAAPETVQNFIDLAKSGFYDGLTFHRIMEGFMMQGGDPDGNGTGGSGKHITGEFSANGHENPISHVRGVISMARAARDNDSASSQFFIVQQDSMFLDGQYAAFGHVTEGMDVVDQICADAQPIDNNGTIPPENQPVITSITIRKA